MNTLNMKKYENVILYLISNMSDKRIHGKKKLAKLLYYVDFDRFEFNESMKTITGDEYHHLPMGPVPENFQQVVRNLADENKLDVKEVQEYNTYHPTTVYSANVEPDMSVFDEDDLKILARVIRHYGSKSGGDLERMSHEEAPWSAVDDQQPIPFELAFYRETDFSDAV